MVVDPTSAVTTWVGRDALMWAFKTRAQNLKAQLNEWDDLDKAVERVTDLERRSGVEVPAVKTDLREEAARKLAHRLVFGDWIARRHASWRWIEGTLLIVGGLSFVVGGALLFSAPRQLDGRIMWPIYLTVALVGLVILACPLLLHWVVANTPMLKDNENKLYKALTGLEPRSGIFGHIRQGRDVLFGQHGRTDEQPSALNEGVSTEKVPTAVAEALPQS